MGMLKGMDAGEFDIALTAEELLVLGSGLHTRADVVNVDLEECEDKKTDSGEDISILVSEIENRRLRLRLYYVVGGKTSREGLERVTSDRAGRERLESMLVALDEVSGVDMTNVGVGDLGELDRARSERYGLRKGECLYEVEYTYEMDVQVVGDSSVEFELGLTYRLMEWMVDEGAVAVFDWVTVGRVS